MLTGESSLYAYYFSHKERTQIVYAVSEKEARAKFKRYFGVPAGDLIRRENW